MTDSTYLEQSSIKCGVPDITALNYVFQSGVYKELEDYSYMFQSFSSPYLINYRWIKDALHQWSRIYEYPFCYHHLSSNLSKASSILDAGSGVTFFPFFLNQKFNVTCIDIDNYSEIYKNINEVLNTNVNFSRQNLKQIELGTKSIDAIYCISVLEHTNEYKQIISEFYRLLKTGGELVLTFDISLDDNKEGVSHVNAQHIIEQLKNYFEVEYTIQNLSQDLSNNNIYDTKYALKHFENYLPWPKRTWKNLIKSYIYQKPIYYRENINMTFCNLVCIKR